MGLKIMRKGGISAGATGRFRRIRKGRTGGEREEHRKFFPKQPSPATFSEAMKEKRPEKAVNQDVPTPRSG